MTETNEHFEARGNMTSFRDISVSFVSLPLLILHLSRSWNNDIGGILRFGFCVCDGVGHVGIRKKQKRGRRLMKKKKGGAVYYKPSISCPNIVTLDAQKLSQLCLTFLSCNLGKDDSYSNLEQNYCVN